MNVLKLIQRQKTQNNIIITKKGNERVFEDFQRASDYVYDINIRKVSILSLIKVVHVIYTHKPNIVHAHGNAGGLYTFLASLVLFKPFKIIYTFRGFHLKGKKINRSLKMAFEWLFSFFVDKYVAVSNSEKQKILKSGNFYKKKLIKIHNGVQVKKRPLSHAQQETLNKYDINFITISRISPQKDLEVMIRSLTKINRNRKEKIGLHVMGGYIKDDEAYKNKIYNLVRELDKDNVVNFWGEVPHAGSYISNFDIYISTSLWEGLQTALIESLMSKTPTVTTNVVGNVDIINDNTGYLLPTNNPNNLYRIINTCIDETISKSNKNLITSGFNYAMKEFSLKRHTTQINNLYESILHLNEDNIHL